MKGNRRFKWQKGTNRGWNKIKEVPRKRSQARGVMLGTLEGQEPKGFPEISKGNVGKDPHESWKRPPIVETRRMNGGQKGSASSGVSEGSNAVEGPKEAGTEEAERKSGGLGVWKLKSNRTKRIWGT